MAKKRSEAEADATTQDRLNAKRKAIRQAVKELWKVYQEQRTTDLLWWHQVGTLVIQTEERWGGTYSLFDELAANLCPKDLQSNDKHLKAIANSLTQARVFAREFSTGPKLRKWAKGLPVMHVRELLRVTNKAKREELRDRCVDDELSGREVMRLVQEEKGRKEGRGGRPRDPQNMATPALAVRQMALRAERWLHLHSSCLKPLKKRITGKDRDAFLAEVGKAIKRLEEVSQAVAKEQDVLESIRDQCQTARRNR